MDASLARKLKRRLLDIENRHGEDTAIELQLGETLAQYFEDYDSAAADGTITASENEHLLQHQAAVVELWRRSLIYNQVNAAALLSIAQELTPFSADARKRFPALGQLTIAELLHKQELQP